MPSPALAALTPDQLDRMFPGAKERGFTDDELRAALGVVDAVAEAIRDSGGIPSVHLYAALMDRMSLGTYQGIIATLKRAGLVTESGHYLTWIGPKA